MRVSPDDTELARIFLEHSLKIKPKEKVLITTSEAGENPLVKAVFIEALKMGAFPVLDMAGVDFNLNRAFAGGLAYQFYHQANDWQLNYLPKEILTAKVDWADAYVRIVSIDNTKELNQIETARLTKRMGLSRSIFDKMINSDRWILTYYPTPGMAQEAGVSYDWLLDFYYSACVVDYKKMENSLLKLEKRLDQGREVRVVGEDTDLRLSIAGRLAKACFGERNIPDGEVFLAPVKQSASGKVYFDFPSLYAGREIQGVRLEFKNGKVVKAQARQGQEALNSLLKSDPGASFLGEFAIGANYRITQPMKNTLFDEKIGGTIHMALGRAYVEKRGGAPQGGNVSAIHWDIVKDMRPKGSVVYIDGRAVLENGRLTP